MGACRKDLLEDASGDVDTHWWGASQIYVSSDDLVYGDVPFVDVVYSLGTENLGALTLHNYPYHLQNLRPQDSGARPTSRQWRSSRARRSSLLRVRAPARNECTANIHLNGLATAEKRHPLLYRGPHA